MTKRVILMMEIDEDQEVEDLLDFDSIDENVVHQNLIYQDEMVELDPRQLKAITNLLLGFDLPANMMNVANNMLMASFFNKDATIGNMGSDNRKVCLQRARDAIDQLLQEIQ